jgi:tRNA pseudouridine55 synthase
VSRPGRQEVASGLVVVDKPAGLTSHDVVSRIRRLAGTRKVGHAGTLDPMATGVLVLGIERATRMLGHLMLTEKAYDATIRLGQSTTTDDAEGDLLSQHSTSGLDVAAVRTALVGFVGSIQQVPTAVSAIKVDGKRAYQRVREGEQVELAARAVVVHELVVHEVANTASDLLDVRISVRCSSGTYIRAIARDLGRELGVGGHLVGLRRTAVGPFTLARAHTLAALTEEWSLIPLSAAARACFPAYDLTDADAAAARVGRSLTVSITGLSAVFAPDGEFLALYEPRGDLARPVAVFVG